MDVERAVTISLSGRLLHTCRYCILVGLAHARMLWPYTQSLHDMAARHLCVVTPVTGRGAATHGQNPGADPCDQKIYGDFCSFAHRFFGGGLLSGENEGYGGPTRPPETHFGRFLVAYKWRAAR